MKGLDVKWCRWVSHGFLQRAVSLFILGFDWSQLVCHPLNRRTGATAVTLLPATTSPIKQSSSTSVTRATLSRQTTSSSPARTASGTVPCRSPADSHKVCSSQPWASFGASDTHHILWHFLFFLHRQGAVVSTGNTGSVHCGIDSQLSGSYPAFSGALCTCTAQTQVLSPEQVRYCMELFSNLLV